MTKDEECDLNGFGIDSCTGFVCKQILFNTPPTISYKLDEISNKLPEYGHAGRKADLLQAVKCLENEQIHQRLAGCSDNDRLFPYTQCCHVASALAHHVDGNNSGAVQLPACLASLLLSLATDLDIRSGLSHATMVLYNCSLQNDSQCSTGTFQVPHIENIQLRVRMSDTADYLWFLAVPSRVEMDAAPGLVASKEAIRASHTQDTELLKEQLSIVEASVTQMSRSLGRMTENCCPVVFYHGFRRYLSKLWPFETDNVESLSAFTNSSDFASLAPKTGATAAQSSTLPFLDRLFGIRPSDQAVSTFLDNILTTMPLPHRKFLSFVKSTSRISPWVQRIAREADSLSSQEVALIESYNRCIKAILTFRQRHMDIVNSYIIKQIKSKGEQTEKVKGTGESNINQFLQCLVRETQSKLINP